MRWVRVWARVCVRRGIIRARLGVRAGRTAVADGCGGSAQCGEQQPAAGLGGVGLPAGVVQMTVPSGSCRSRQPAEGLEQVMFSTQTFQIRRLRGPHRVGDGVVQIATSAGSSQPGNRHVRSRHRTKSPTLPRHIARLRRCIPGMHDGPDRRGVRELGGQQRRGQHPPPMITAGSVSAGPVGRGGASASAIVISRSGLLPAGRGAGSAPSSCAAVSSAS